MSSEPPTSIGHPFVQPEGIDEKQLQSFMLYYLQVPLLCVKAKRKCLDAKRTASDSTARVACVALTAEAAKSVCAISIYITVVHFKVALIYICNKRHYNPKGDNYVSSHRVKTVTVTELFDKGIPAQLVKPSPE